MSKQSDRQLAAEQKKVDEWNARVKVGDSVEYREVLDDNKPELFTTRTPADILGGHTAVVWLNNKSGCVCLDHCQPKEAVANVC